MIRRWFTQNLAGLILLIVGLGFLLQELNIWQFNVVLREWWPSVVIAFGVIGLIAPNNDKVGPLITLGIGVLLLLRTLGYVVFDVWSLIWPAIFIMIGLSMMFSSPKSHLSNDKSVDIFVAFGGADRRIDAVGFQGGNVTALFGGAKLNLRKAQIAENAELHTFTAFGGAEIIVPEDCRVVVSATPLFGAWEDKTDHPSEPKSTLRIHGMSLFGGVEIKN